MLKFNHLEDKQGTKVQRQSATSSTHVDHIAKLGPSFRPQFMEIPSYPLLPTTPSLLVLPVRHLPIGFTQPQRPPMEASFSRVSKKLSKELTVLLTVPKFLPPGPPTQRETVPPRVDRRPKEEWPSPLVQRVGAE